MLPRFGHLAVKSKIGPKIQRTVWRRQTQVLKYDSNETEPVRKHLQLRRTDSETGLLFLVS